MCKVVKTVAGIPPSQSQTKI